MKTVLPLRGLLIIASIDLFVLVFGTLGASGRLWFKGGRDVLSLAMASICVITFFGFLVLSQALEQDRKTTEGWLRTAIAASIVTVYLVVVATVAFYAPISSGEDLKLHPMTKEMVNSFTYMVGVVIAFFFGSSAYIDAQRGRKVSEDKQKEN